MLTEDAVRYRNHGSSSSDWSSKSRADALLLFCAFLAATAALLSVAFTAVGHALHRSMLGLQQLWKTMLRQRRRRRGDGHGVTSTNLTSPEATVGASETAGTTSSRATISSASPSASNFLAGSAASASVPQFLSELNASVNAYGGVSDDVNVCRDRDPPSSSPSSSSSSSSSSPSPPRGSASSKYEETSSGCSKETVADSGKQSSSSSDGFPSQ